VEGGTKRSGHLTHERMKTPRAAAIAGIIFSVLLMATQILLHASVSTSAQEPRGWTASDSGSLRLALNFVPFAGIAFLWFIGVVRDRLGEREDRFFATVFLGSGLLFLAMFFAAAAVAGAVIVRSAALPDAQSASEAYVFGRALSGQIMNVFALKMAGVFMISTATLAIRTRFLPRWIAIPGYVLAAMLLLASRFVDWLALAFPFWVLVLSIYILVENLGGTKPEAAE